MPEQSLPPLHCKLFGSFQIIDINLSGPNGDGEDLQESTVDVGFGSDTGHFSGCHRFSLRRSEDEKGRLQLHLGLACLAGNPTDPGSTTLGLLKGFHKVYATSLFRAAVARVKQQLEGR